MISKTPLIQPRLQTSIQKCNLYLQRLTYASNQLAGFSPLTVDRYTALSEETIGNIDQLVFHTKIIDFERSYGTRISTIFILLNVSNLNARFVSLNFRTRWELTRFGFCLSFFRKTLPTSRFVIF